MLMGVVAGQDPGSAQIPLAVSYLGKADFVNGVYTWGATTLTASQVTDSIGLITPGTGLIIPNSGTPPKLLNQFANFLFTCQWVAVVDIITDADTFYILYVDNQLSSGVVSHMAILGDGLTFGFDVEDRDGGPHRSVTDDVTPSPAGAHKIAGRRTDAHLAISVDGSGEFIDGAATTIPLPNANDASPPGAAGATMQGAYLGGESFNTGGSASVTIKSIALYDSSAVQPSDLPALSG